MKVKIIPPDELFLGITITSAGFLGASLMLLLMQ